MEVEVEADTSEEESETTEEVALEVEPVDKTTTTSAKTDEKTEPVKAKPVATANRSHALFVGLYHAAYAKRTSAEADRRSSRPGRRGDGRDGLATRAASSGGSTRGR